MEILSYVYKYTCILFKYVAYILVSCFNVSAKFKYTIILYLCECVCVSVCVCVCVCECECVFVDVCLYVQTLCLLVCINNHICTIILLLLLPVILFADNTMQ